MDKCFVYDSLNESAYTRRFNAKTQIFQTKPSQRSGDWRKELLCTHSTFSERREENSSEISFQSIRKLMLSKASTL